MSESLTSLLIIFSEIGIFLGLFFVVLVFLLIRRKSKDTSMARKFIASIQASESDRKTKIIDVLKRGDEMGDEEANKMAETMLGHEKQIYSSVLRLFLRKQSEELTQVKNGIENMASAYCDLAEASTPSPVSEDNGDDHEQTQMRNELKQVTAERNKIQKDLDEAMISMDNMLKEYTQMYAGGSGKKEGVKHLENELSQLKEKIKGNLIDLDGDSESTTAVTSGQAGQDKTA